MLRTYLQPKGAPRPVSYYTLGLRVGSRLYSSGQTAREASGQLVGQGDARRQAEQAVHNLSLVLAEGGLRAEDIVRLNLFVRRADDLPAILGVIARFLEANRPALTAAVVESLAFPEYLLEVEAIASAPAAVDWE